MSLIGDLNQSPHQKIFPLAQEARSMCPTSQTLSLKTHRPWFSFRLFAACLVCVRCKFGMSRVLSFCFHPGFLPFVFSSRTGARATYACAHARCVCLHCNCAEMQGSLFVYADTHTCVRQSPVQKIKNAASQISRARSGRVFSPVQIKGRKEA